MTNIASSCHFGIQQEILEWNGPSVLPRRHFSNLCNCGSTFKLQTFKDPIMSNIKKAVFGALMTITLLGGAVSASAQPVCQPQHPGQTCEYDAVLKTCICN
ncbi:hypothetical protein pRALTA_0598 (plasmid) [Cupriavidus taiwanensis LMG 19424]|uniref:Uncharacterized protein n=3 Tax=Cupriavidus TaxID=106589 RepID=B2AJG9_CUPTR|nr:hypothetical protein pRALTA_0598 [Cupriavidus taiwanensis LMG 19424]